VVPAVNSSLHAPGPPLLQQFKDQQPRQPPNPELGQQLRACHAARLSVRALKAMAALFRLPKAQSTEQAGAPLEFAALRVARQCGGPSAEFSRVLPLLLRRVQAGEAPPLHPTQAWSNAATAVLREVNQPGTGWEQV